MIRAVLFDLDGVVRHFDPQGATAIEHRYRLLEGSLSTAAFQPALLHEVITGRITRRQWVRRIGDHLQQPAAAVEWSQISSTADEDVLLLADDLRAAGYVVAILTNGTDTTRDEVTTLGISDRFDVLYNSAEIGHAKPDAQAFEHVLDHLGLRGPEVFFTDDSASKTAGAEQLGMSVHLFRTIERLRTALGAVGVTTRSGNARSSPSAESR